MTVFSFGGIYLVSINTQAPVAETTSDCYPQQLTKARAAVPEGSDQHLGWFAHFFYFVF